MFLAQVWLGVMLVGADPLDGVGGLRDQVAGAVVPLVPAPSRLPPYSPFGPYELIDRNVPYYLTAPQPTGHQIISTGPNGYVYRPTYAVPVLPVAVAPLAPPSVGPSQMATNDMVAEATSLFLAGRYADVLTRLQTVAPSDRRIGLARLLESNAYFALERYPQAVASLEAALAVLPENAWGSIVADHRDWYGASRYVDHLRALEMHVAAVPTDAAARLLLGYHAGSLGQKAQALAQLRQVTNSQLSRRLELHFGGLVTNTAVTNAPVNNAPPPAPAELEPTGPRAF